MTFDSPDPCRDAADTKGFEPGARNQTLSQALGSVSLYEAALGIL